MTSELPPPNGGTLLHRAPDAVQDPPPSDTGADPGAGPGAEWRHLASLDGMRGVAVLAVLLFHGDLLTGGFLGVDLFFTLSGFLITSLLLTEARRSGRVDLVAFWGRRFRRLLPAILVLLAVVIIVTWLIGTPAQLDAVHRGGLPALGYAANWHQIAQDGGYWASFAEASPLTHLWSLAIEEQFYVVWPLVFFGLWKLSRGSERAIAVAAGLGALGSAVLMAVVHTGGDPTRVYMGTDTRAFSILFGVMVATAPVRTTVTRLVRAHRSVAQVGLMAIVTAGVFVWASVDGASSSVLFEGGLAAHAALGAVLIVCCAADDGLLAARLFSGKVLGYVGTRSYGLYLWHWPVYVALDAERTGLDGARAVHGPRGRFVRARRDLLSDRRNTDPPSRAVGARPKRRCRHDVRIRRRHARVRLGAAGDRRHCSVRPAGDHPRHRARNGRIHGSDAALAIDVSRPVSAAELSPDGGDPAPRQSAPDQSASGHDSARDHDHPPAAETVAVERPVDG